MSPTVESAKLMIATIKARRIEQDKERVRTQWRRSKRKKAAEARAAAKEAAASAKRYQIEQQRAVQQFRHLVSEQNPNIQMVFPMVEVVGPK